MTAHTNFFRPLRSDGNVDQLFDDVCQLLLTADAIDTGHWQGKSGTPMSETRELLNVRLELPIAATPGAWAAWMRPNLPWAEDHFKERVSGEPLNPPPSHVYWPFNQAGNKDHLTGKVFSHSYPERLWPKRAGAWASNGPIGIRYPAGDLDDLVQLLVREPHTRQAYIPLWYPEDLSAANKSQRVPCTLGYHFILRKGRLNCFYPMRSLDWLRYFRDDAYMAGRLCQWVIEQCQHRSGGNSYWQDVAPGRLVMDVVSLHIFEGDLPNLKRELTKKGKVPV